MVVLGGVAVSYEQGTPVARKNQDKRAATINPCWALFYPLITVTPYTVSVDIVAQGMTCFFRVA